MSVKIRIHKEVIMKSCLVVGDFGWCDFKETNFILDIEKLISNGVRNFFVAFSSEFSKMYADALIKIKKKCNINIFIIKTHDYECEIFLLKTSYRGASFDRFISNEEEQSLINTIFALCDIVDYLICYVKEPIMGLYKYGHIALDYALNNKIEIIKYKNNNNF